MTTTAINFRVDEQLKKDADIILNEMGMNLSTALTMTLKRIVDDGALPFTPRVSDPFYSKENLDYLRKAKESFEKGNHSEHELFEVE
ncbi:MAG: type II toxin-antitoxin system RelB/DinJ family antitoxin [Lactobacillales bacterium]|jgi:DNA-damage-inducible protein J|nr:type II toxin-antitoxin system RelB/DinJ family antitoxin [Lactobacillales bacterium]